MSESTIAVKNQGDVRKLESDKVTKLINKFGVYLMIILLMIVGVFVNPKFLSLDNFKNIIQAVAFLGIACSGMAFITYSGHMADMSLPITIALSGIVTVSLLRFGFVVGIAGGITAGLLVGLINAIVIGKFRANPIIWTLSLNFLLSGVIRWAYSNRQIYPDVETGGSIAGDMFTNISRTYILGIPLGVIVMLVMLLAGQFILSKTKYGKQIKIVGSNMEVAQMTGINVTKVVSKAYLLSAFAASVAGIFITSFGKVGAYYNGEGYDFRAVTAIIIGGMTLVGGKGNMIGVLGGVFTIGLLSNVMTLIGIGTFEQQIVTGIIFILIVWMGSKSSRKLGLDNA